jgi:hypothetical protein
MQYIDVPQTEAEDKEGKVKDGYEKWAYSWKKVIPDTPEEKAAKEKQANYFAKAKSDLEALIAIQDADKGKVTLQDVLNRLEKIEILMGIRKNG